ncbi:MAG: aminoacyl-tRNA hydrolase [Gammaproteobacteria bacterium]|nr:aminoacyl-tRNA hydrolase [Gammaproteobacteria bacterium]
MIFINDSISLAEHEVEISAIRAQGTGGQNVNKVASAIHLRFDIKASSLSDSHKEYLLASNDSRINKEGILIIKAQQFRSQEQNKIDALARLQHVIIAATYISKIRKPSKPSKSARRKRMEQKNQRSITKALRTRVDF